MVSDTRTERICVNETEKNRLQDLREDIYDTDSVPVGEVLTHLMDEYSQS